MSTICGIIGFSGTNITENDIETLKKVMIESRIRGKHASGIAWYDGNRIQSVVKAIPIDKLVEKFDFNQLLSIKGKVVLIAHARYSTSDIKYNQPIVGKHWAIAHNGVITQSPPDTWYKLYGYKCKTKNDSELLLKSLEQNDDLYEKFPNSSISSVAINDKGELLYFRNSIRPMWYGFTDNGTIYASTYDILRRADVKGITKVSSMDYVDLQNRSMKKKIGGLSNGM